MAQGVAKEGECTILSGLIPASLISMPQSRMPMKKRTRVLARTPGVDGSRKVTGTHLKTTTSRTAARGSNQTRNKARTKAKNKVK